MRSSGGGVGSQVIPDGRTMPVGAGVGVGVVVGTGVGFVGGTDAGWPQPARLINAAADAASTTKRLVLMPLFSLEGRRRAGADVLAAHPVRGLRAPARSGGDDPLLAERA